VSKPLGNRRTSGDEQYYTPAALAENLIAELFTALPDIDHSKFLEPAGGTGSFITALQNRGVRDIKSFDTHPKHELVEHGDFLSQNLEGEAFVTVSNPPFGRNNALAVPFFNHAANFSTHIAFLVPRSWRKWSVINRLHPNFHLISDCDVEVIFESESGEPVAVRNDLRSCFQIWERRAELRARISVPQSGLIKKVKPKDADVAFRCFGFGAGRIYREFERGPNTTLMFLAVREPWVIDLLEDLDYSVFAHNTAYTKAVSFQEINYLINERLWGNGFRTKEAQDE
jgi:hypothetical protein